MNGKSRLAINLFSVINSDFPDSMDYHIAEFILNNFLKRKTPHKAA